ncbi:Uncharacterized protein TCM_027562 [Theobroma cacao]|uniref:Uncharacterized protein n=1 Tax=Theobroma cacao TaxID=3641 RepID=A0A061GGJ8_THECC|nr:Uncharacterized protein TCM_027562 [Theobroma cacao]
MEGTGEFVDDKSKTVNVVSPPIKARELHPRTSSLSISKIPTLDTLPTRGNEKLILKPCGVSVDIPAATSKSTYGLMPSTVVARVSSSELNGYQEIKNDMKELKIDVHDIKSTMKAILESFPNLADGSSSSQ